MIDYHSRIHYHIISHLICDSEQHHTQTICLYFAQIIEFLSNFFKAEKLFRKSNDTRYMELPLKMILV